MQRIMTRTNLSSSAWKCEGVNVKKKLYIAYGSNTYAPQMKRRCPEAKLIGTGFLKDYELEFRGAATVIPKPDAKVPVVLWEITELNEERLDVCEGVPHGVYRKEECTVEVDGKPISGIIYMKNGGSIFPPKEGYAKRMLLGYRQNGLDVQYIHAALDRAYLAQEDQDEDLSEAPDITQN